MTQMPGGYNRQHVGNDPLTGKPMYRDTPGAGWTDQAATWPVAVVSRETEPGHFLAGEGSSQIQVHLCCTRCAEYPSVFCLNPGPGPIGYTTMTADLLAGILGHIRRSHPDVVASS